ncbi:alpha/beta hydrolase [Mycoplasmatota bacterium]|nr:alpha/beta hydrolase [Mycoplasmatota bacterium]
MICINQIKINVEISGQGDMNILLLHGWGQSTKAFTEISQHLATSFTVYNIDLPGFGLSEKPPYPYNTKDYADIIKGIVDYYQLDNLIIIGHSFGGRIAIKYTTMYNHVEKLVLIDSAGIVHKKKLNYYLKVYTYKLLKKCFSIPFLKKYKQKLLGRFGSSDYKNADNFMKQILVKVVNEDLRHEMNKIICPTLLIWGTEDNETPIEDAYIMKKMLGDAGIVKIENAGHFSYLENRYLFLSVLDVFLKEKG